MRSNANDCDQTRTNAIRWDSLPIYGYCMYEAHHVHRVRGRGSRRVIAEPGSSLPSLFTQLDVPLASWF